MNPWTDEDIGTIERGLRDGLSASQIAAQLGRTRNSVIGKCARIGLRLNGGNPKSSAKAARRADAWTDETWRRFSELWNAGRTSADIGKAFGISASRVKQRAAERRDLCPARSPAWSARKAARFRTAAGRYASRHGIGLRDNARREAESYDADALNVTMMDLRSGMCRWPVNSPERGGEFLFCGHEVASGESYCQHHHLRGTVPTRRARA